ncbi:MAG TPA: S4 domain-containing protein YaaA [Virgibacillus sp.]|nr:S4 domain-containing protein YaaA [Virgibacillus sp.]
MHEKIEISTEFITLGQFIKLANVLESGGMIKSFLRDEGVLVNGELEHRRGRKLYHNDIVEIEGIGSYITVKQTE